MEVDIVDLSSPEGKSVNDGIPKEQSSLSYVSVDDVVHQVLKLIWGAYIAKMDVKQAYRNVPVHPTDSLLLRMQWEDMVYIDRTLPFGLRSAPLIFSALADALQWIMEQQRVSWVDIMWTTVSQWDRLRPRHVGTTWRSCKRHAKKQACQ